MIKTITWNDGYNDYRQCTHTIDTETKKHTFITHLADVDPIEITSLDDIFHVHLSNRQNKTVEVLYSGGVDSELTLLYCLRHHIPVTATTLRLLVDGFVINTHDMYASERFCRQHNVKHNIIDFDAKRFFENGDHMRYLEPYLITEPHVATHLWLFENATGFPILGGDYSWPWNSESLLSPHRLEFSCYDRFLHDNNIHGIGGMINYSSDANQLFIKTHLKLYEQEIHSTMVSKLKPAILADMGYYVEPRFRSWGWEHVPKTLFNLPFYKNDLIERFGETTSSISWNQQTATAMSGTPGINDRYR